MNRILMQFALLLWIAVCALAQDGEKATFHFAEPDGSKTLVVSVFRGNITVRARAGKDVVVEVRGPRGSIRLNSKQSGNEIRVFLLPADHGDLNIEVPADTSLRIDTATAGEISVEGVTGAIEANNMHGGIRLINVSGAIKAFSMSGDLVVNMRRVPSNAMGFSTFEGGLDITLPASSQASLSRKSSRGNVQ